MKYPAPFIYTSTRDDRVHPGHARKFAATLEAYHDLFYYDEAIEGGHAAGVEPKEDAERVALNDLRHQGEIGDEVFRRMQYDIDLAESRLLVD